MDARVGHTILSQLDNRVSKEAYTNIKLTDSYIGWTIEAEMSNRKLTKTLQHNYWLCNNQSTLIGCQIDSR